MTTSHDNAHRKTGNWSLSGATVVLSGQANEIMNLAAGELSRYLYLLTGKLSPVARRLPESGIAIVLDRRIASSLGVSVDPAVVGDQGYRLATVRQDRRRYLVITATQPVGILYGVYGLLEELGMGFYAGGDTFPELPTRAEIPSDLDRHDRPAFQVRGNLLHYNFLCGPTDWGLDDYKFYFDQLARMRCNMLLMHWYDAEPTAAYEVNGEYLAGGVTPNALTKPWGALAALRASEFYFGTGRYFDQEFFTSPMGEDSPDLLTEIKRSEAVFSEATHYARQRGVKVAAGFEAPWEWPQGDPTNPRVIENFKARIRQFLERNPAITYFGLWQHESGGCTGTAPPPAGSEAASLFEQQREMFAYLGTERRVWEAIRFGRFAAIAADLVAAEAPGLPLVIVGWGGDRWMRFADYCLGYDKILPAHVAFTCLDNIDASFGPNVSTPWGELPPERERWAMPWAEDDVDDCWVRQPKVESLAKLAPDALQKGCQGLLNMQWRTRDAEEENAYTAQFAWDTNLTPEKFYRKLARHRFGPDQEERVGKHLAVLQHLGSRWTGVHGCDECTRMRWTGWVPHFPFELDEKTPTYLLAKAEKAAEMLSEIPPEGEDGEAGAFHLRGVGEEIENIEHDDARPGVQEMKQVAERLRKLAGETAKRRLRAALIEIEEEVWALRERLVKYGMSTRSYGSLDGFLIAIHHMQRNAGAKSHLATLRRIRRDLEKLREQYVAENRLAHLESLDFLTATMDFAVNFDSAVMLLADEERIDQALGAAAQARKTGENACAAEIAAKAYGELIGAGMQQALEAYTRKLTTRGDFGVLATLNVKALPLYWETIGRLEEFLPAVPPREVQVRGQAQEVWLSWQYSPRTAGHHLYRRPAEGGRWRRINKDLLNARCRMFVDRPAEPGVYEYAVTALDECGWESPRSHLGRATCGPLQAGPELVACKPYSHLEMGEDLTLRIVVLTEREIDRVELAFRRAGEHSWRRVPMINCFRYSYRGAVPASEIEPGTLEFYVEAVDSEGNSSVWPQSAAVGLPWSMTVTR